MLVILEEPQTTLALTGRTANACFPFLSIHCDYFTQEVFKLQVKCVPHTQVRDAGALLWLKSLQCSNVGRDRINYRLQRSSHFFS